KLSSNSWAVIEPAVGLPSIDKPRLNLQFCRGKDLHSHSVEEPWRVRRDIGRLIGPVIKVVVAEESDVRHEYSGIDVDPVQGVEVVSAVGFGQITICVVQVPLATRGTSVISRCGL